MKLILLLITGLLISNLLSAQTAAKEVFSFPIHTADSLKGKDTVDYNLILLNQQYLSLTFQLKITDLTDGDRNDTVNVLQSLNGVDWQSQNGAFQMNSDTSWSMLLPGFNTVAFQAPYYRVRVISTGTGQKGLPRCWAWFKPIAGKIN